MMSIRLVVILTVALFMPIFGDEDLEKVATEITLEEITTDGNVTTEIDVSAVDDNSTCDENCTEVTTPNPMKKSSTISSTPKPKQNLINLSGKSKRTCTCDLEGMVCDTNCCCDQDCTYDMRQIFSTCNDDLGRVYDTSMCEYTKYIYKNNTPFEWTVNQNGLFCVLKTNLPPHLYLHKQVKLNSINDTFLVKKGKFGWSTNKGFQITSKNNITFKFSHGKPVWLVNERRIIKWVIPDSLHNEKCSITKEVKLLHDMATKCDQYYISNENKQLNLLSYVQNISIVNLSPLSKYFNQKRLTLLQSCPKNVCHNYELLVCNEMLEECIKVNETASLEHKCRKENDTNMCKNLLHKLTYHVYHNGTNGIVKVDVLANLKSLRFTEETVLRQYFEVKFLWINQHINNYTLQRSGNPGYIFGKPILTANLVERVFVISKKPLNISKNATIERNPLNNNNHFLTLPANKNGKCILTNKINTQIEYGINTLINCKIREVVTIKSKKSKEICREIQEFILGFFQIISENSTKLFGKYGNANVSNFEDWGNVSFAQNPGELLRRVSSVFSSHKSHANCIGLCTKLKIDVFRARSIVEDLHDQERIVWITYGFDNYRNMTFHIVNDTVSLDVALRCEITFFDVSTEKFRKYADPPTLDIKLPYDFFYPFVKIESSSFRANLCYYLLWTLLILKAIM